MTGTGLALGSFGLHKRMPHATARSVPANAEARTSEKHPRRSLVSCHMLLETSSRGYQPRSEIGQHGHLWLVSYSKINGCFFTLPNFILVTAF